MKNLILGLVLTVVSITGLAGFNSAVAAESTISVVTSSPRYRYEYRRLNSEWMMKLTYTQDGRLVDIDVEHIDN